MTLELDTLISDDGWRRIANPAAMAERCVREALRAADAPAERCEISLLLTDDAHMRALNAQFRERDRATNVLSWPSETLGHPLSSADFGSEARFLGDVALGYQTVAAEAEESGLPIERHASHLIVHGVLHLLGYDHQSDEDAALMEARETAALRAMGLPDPYADQPEV